MTKLIQCGAVLAFVLAGPALACRSPVDPAARASFEARQREDDFRQADIVLVGVLASTMPNCASLSCATDVVTGSVVKGPSKSKYVLRTDDILIGCSPRIFELNVEGTFYLTNSDGGYFVIRSETAPPPENGMDQRKLHVTKDVGR